MFNALIRLMAIAALLQLGIKITDFDHCHSKQCLQQLEKRSRDVLKVEWKPISVFPEDAKRFR